MSRSILVGIAGCLGAAQGGALPLHPAGHPPCDPGTASERKRPVSKTGRLGTSGSGENPVHPRANHRRSSAAPLQILERGERQRGEDPTAYDFAIGAFVSSIHHW
jgi:hypothetical protein